MVASRQPVALAVTCIFPILATVFVAARTVSRFLGQNFGWDDWLIHLATILLIGETIAVYEYILLSYTGYHAIDVPKQSVDQQVLALKWSFAVQMFYHPMMGAIRASIILFLFRVRDRRRCIKLSLRIASWMNIGYTVSTSLVNIFQCSPVKYAFLRPQMDHEVDANGKVIKHGKCINSLDFIMGSCAMSIIMDLIIIPIPTVMVWNLQMRRKTKIGVVAVMSMGWIATAASVGRLIVYYDRNTTSDRTRNIGLVSSITEPSIGIIAACAPALRRLLIHLMPKYFFEQATCYFTNKTAEHIHTQGNVPKRSTLNLNFRCLGNSDKQTENISRGAMNEDRMYDMRPVKSVSLRENSSQEKFGVIIAEIDSTDVDVEAQKPDRTYSVRTGVSDVPGHLVEAVPDHALNS